MANVGKVAAVEDIYSFTRTGIVQDSHSRMDTSVSTTTSHTGGYNSRATTNTSVSSTEMLRIFVRQDGDKGEFEAEFADPAFGVREGHHVTVVYAGDQASQAGYPMALVNHSTERHQIFAKRTEWIINRTNQWMGCLTLIGLPLIVALLFMAMTPDLFVIGFVMGLIGTGIWMFGWKRKNDALAAAIVDVLNKHVREATEAQTKAG